MIPKDLATAKLIVLFVAETMECPLTNDVLTDICDRNKWVAYMECKQCISDLIEHSLLINISKNNTPLYLISKDGRECLSHFYNKIPLTTREAIKNHIKEHRQQYRKKQEYWSDYYTNADGSYTVILRINTAANPLLELKLCVQNRSTAVWLHKTWIDKAPNVYELIYESLM